MVLLRIRSRSLSEANINILEQSYSCGLKVTNNKRELIKRIKVDLLEQTL